MIQIELLKPPTNPNPTYEKMSKSKGNGVMVDEVVHGVFSIKQGYEFRNLDETPIDYKAWGVWQHGSGYYFTAHRYKCQPVFLCEIGEPIPCSFFNCYGIQHPYLLNWWEMMDKKYNVFEKD